MAKQNGFTLIELIIVIVLLGILASVALPRFIDVTGDAHSANVTGTAGAIASGINLAHAKWLATGQPTSSNPIRGVDLTGSSKQDTGFNVLGWPNAATNGSANITKVDVLGGSGNDNSICAQIVTNILSTSSVTIGSGASCGKDYCATFASDICTYTYQQDPGTPRTISYNTKNGTISKVTP